MTPPLRPRPSQTLAAMLACGIGISLSAADTPAAITPIDKALESPITLDARAQPLRDLLNALSHQANLNLVANWPALAPLGITPDTPVTLRLTDIPCEAAIRTLLHSLPTPGDLPQLNYTVGSNALELTTNAALGKITTTRLHDIAALLARAPAGDQATHADLLLHILRAQWKWAGEPPPGTASRALLIQDHLLIATASRRAQLLIQKTLALISNPTPAGQTAPAAMLSVRAKRAADALKPFTNTHGDLPLIPWSTGATPLPPGLNIVILPAARAELAKPAPDLDSDITSAGILEIDSRPHLRQRPLLAAYDLRDLLKHLARTKQTSAQLLATLQRSTSAIPWGPFDQSPATMTLYGTTLLISAPPAAQRTLAHTLHELDK